MVVEFIIISENYFKFITVPRYLDKHYFLSKSSKLLGCHITCMFPPGNYQTEIFIFITLLGDQRRPWPQVYPFTSSVLRDQNFNFSCQVPGNGVSITWLKNGGKVQNHQTQLQSRKTLKGIPLNENILMLKTVSWVDAANYTCVVTTSQQPGYSSNITRELFVEGTVKSAIIVIYFLWSPDQLCQLCSGSDVDHSFRKKHVVPWMLGISWVLNIL